MSAREIILGMILVYLILTMIVSESRM